ncbi:MAG: UDP-N-acetylmuramyl-tripeptide synthetase, partial [Phycisphaerales bacterium]|nr:UDP-N-acetylmuramyl-tripeptide synthetase [Phycisphaerales bacterium]
MLLGELIDGLPIEIARGDAATVRVCDLTEDSRTAVPGSLFIARCGLTVDGRVYAHDAVLMGACAILTDAGADLTTLPARVPVVVCADVPLMTALLAERLFGHPSRRLLLVGVTGTNGKTTVTHLIHQLLNRCGVRCGMIGTVEVDDGTEIAPAVMTTPPAIETSRTLATMVESRCDAAVMEVSSHALDQKRADGLSFDAAVFTNVSGDHGDYHESFETYVAAKRRLIGLLDSGVGGPAVLNADDPLVGSCEAARPVRCGMHAGTGLDWAVERRGSTLDGERVSVRGEGIEITARVALFGAHNAMNTLQAVAVTWDLLGRAGLAPELRRRMIADALTLVHPPRGRLEPMHGAGDDIAVFVDFAHTDDALSRSLEALREAKPSAARLWV